MIERLVSPPYCKKPVTMKTAVVNNHWHTSPSDELYLYSGDGMLVFMEMCNLHFRAPASMTEVCSVR